MIFENDSYRIFLGDELARRTKTNPRYSQRAFAKNLGMSAGELSEILRGKRKLSLKSAGRISRNMSLSSLEAKHLAFLVQNEKSDGLDNTQPSQVLKGNQLSLDLFALVSDWYCFAILNLSECQGFRWNTRWIAERLGISRNEARMAIERLQRVGLVERKKGRLVVSADFVLSPDGIPSAAIRSYHRQILMRALQALEIQSLSEREISGITFAINPRDLPSLKKDVSKFLDEVAAKYSKSRPKTEVYQLEAALFRLTKGESYATH